MDLPRGPEQISLAGFLAAPEDGAVARRMALAQWARTALKPLGQTPARHHELLLKHLAGLAEGKTDRLMILMPPGSAKSTYASLIFPAWFMHMKPQSSVIAASHTAELAGHFGRAVRRLIAEHPRELGLEVSKESAAAHRFATRQGGEYFASGLGGAITGRRADLVLIDDPIKSHAEADSAMHRDQAWNWYRSELLPRLKPGGRIALIMTRWHQDDMAGRLLESGDDWSVLRLPALAESDDPMGRKVGDALWPGWENREALARKREIVGSRIWQALYQQSPRPDSGALFRVPRIEVQEVAPGDLRCVRAWDLAATEASAGRDPDWTVGLKLGRDAAGRIFVLDVLRMRGGPNAVTEAILGMAHQDGRGVAVGLPQDPGQAGKQQVAWLTQRLAGHRVVASPETGSKMIRAMPVAAQIEAGHLALGTRLNQSTR